MTASTLLSPSLLAEAQRLPGRHAPARQHFEVRPFSHAPFGAEIVGLRLDQSLHAEDFARVHEAHLKHHVVVFRDQRITPAQHVNFSRRFGPLQVHVQKKFQLAGHPEVLIVSNIKENGEPIGLGDAGHFWHSDLSYKERPSLGSLLHAQELPAEGGDTLFADQHAAYDALPEALKKAIAPLRAEHSYLARYEELRARSPWRPALTQAQLDEVRPVVHPVVRTHPETGRKALFVSEHFTTRIVGLPEDESRAVLEELFARSTQPALTLRHRWQPHDIVFWDNRSVLHLAAGTPEHLRRKLYRTTIEGDAPR
ncbi:TauD/TfdA family dioxygenase [Xenophilus arseniciresistens]|uniref:TauD/TfdA family dioxygenase n=1 Tax=Xenophilus arseniciresistens TaxID=1283306 RepID=A0AAE3NBI8_9BURK|nr:TauD/TfdA family dioxygenase [Xenophilus arseniciresistens]MDA7418313.1 TauD/TfdA family dioxygenase [Xenophilus arseniciresistens]